MIRVKKYIRKVFAPVSRLLLDVFRYTPIKRFIQPIAEKLHRGMTAQGIKKIKYLGFNWRLNIANFLERDIYLENWELPETALCKNKIKEGMVVFDIGANIGYYSVLYSSYVGENGKVYAFEPIKHYFQHLKEHLEMNNVTNVQAEKLILSDKKGVLEIFPGESSARVDLPDGDQSAWKKHLKEEVLTITIDEYVKEQNIGRLDFIKLDVDGHESFVLEGAKRTLEEYSPLILLEFCEEHQSGAGRTCKQQLDLITSYKYDLYDIHTMEKINDLQSFEKRLRDNYDRSFDVLCIKHAT